MSPVFRMPIERLPEVRYTHSPTSRNASAGAEGTGSSRHEPTAGSQSVHVASVGSWKPASAPTTIEVSYPRQSGQAICTSWNSTTPPVFPTPVGVVVVVDGVVVVVVVVDVEVVVVSVEVEEVDVVELVPG